MRKYGILLLLFLLFTVVGWWIYDRLNNGAASVSSSESSDSGIYTEAIGSASGEEGATRRPAIASSIKEAVQDPPVARKYNLPEDVKQIDLLETVLSSVSGNLIASGLTDKGWENDWSEEGADSRIAKTFYKSNAAKDKVVLYSYLSRAGTDYTETVLRGYMQKCSYPSQDALIETLRKEDFRVEKPTAPVHGFGSSYWTSVYRVQRDALDGLTYYESPALIPGCLKLILTDNKREKALYTSEPDLKELFAAELPGRLFREIEDAGIAGAPGGDWAKTKEISTSTGPLYATQLEILAKTYSAVEKSPLKEDKIPAASILKGYLVRQIFSRGGYYEANPGEGGGGKPFREILDQNGIKYYESHYGGVEPQKSFFDMGIYEKYPDSYWGQFSFLLNMDSGFSTGDCYYGLVTDKVIKEGDSFARKYPGSPFYSDVIFLLGQAYETLYNQGLGAGACDQYIGKSCEELISGNEKNREKASELYTSALAAPGGEKYRVYVESVLPRLKTRSRTFCYKYFPRCD